MTDSALIVVDMLYDFIDGTLACTNAENAVSEAARFIEKVSSAEKPDESEISDTYPVLFVCDRHPSDHCSFSSNGGSWPAHCVEGTRGSEVHERLRPYMTDELVFLKGCDSGKEQYSGFEGCNKAGQSLGEVLELLDIHEVHVCGIATEFCVKETCEDLLRAGFGVRLVKDALAYVDKEGHETALRTLVSEGVILQ